ncbi:MAG TPA: thiolase family protein [Acidimicrobiales bacterium]|nr:thiolase family protein [Acidimicrobiales bacterium]
MPHPFHDVAIVGVFNTAQSRHLPEHDSASITLEGALGALADAGLEPHDVDAVMGQFSSDDVLTFGLGPCVRRPIGPAIPSVLDAAALIATGQADVVLMSAGGAGIYTDRASTAPWTRPAHEFVVGYGLFTAAEFALIARRHMLTFGTTPEQLATVAATIRNNGHVNPKAVYYGRGPYTPEDVLASRMVADPYHLLDCATTSEGGCGMVLARADRAADLPSTPAYILGGGGDILGPSYHISPRWDLRGFTEPDIPNGYVGRRAARRAFTMAGLGPSDVDVAEFYDPFSFEIIRQLEAFEFCPEGEGGAFVADGNIGPGGSLPITTDGGLMSFGHAGHIAQLLQRVIRGVEQVRGTCETMQVPGAEVAICTNGGAGALFTDVMLVGSERP